MVLKKSCPVSEHADISDMKNLAGGLASDLSELAVLFLLLPVMFEGKGVSIKLFSNYFVSVFLVAKVLQIFLEILRNIRSSECVGSLSNS